MYFLLFLFFSYVGDLYTMEKPRKSLSPTRDRPWQTEQDGKNALHHVQDHKDVETLVKRGVDVNAPDVNGLTPIFLAASPSIAEQLFKNGANLRHRDYNAQSLIRFMKNLSILDKIIKLDPSLIDVVDGKGNTELHVVTERDRALFLVQHKAKLLARNKEGYTPFHTAANN